MANKTLFARITGALLPKPDVINEAGGPAYAFTPKHALAQYAATGCLSRTFYASADDQLGKVLELCGELEPAFIAKTAVFAREAGHMKDMPALLCAVLAAREPALLAQVFGRVIDNGKMLRNFVQIVRSGQAGRKSFGSLPKRLIRNWLESRGDDAIVRNSVGADPSLADIVKMVHPKPATKAREALYGWLLGKAHDAAALPELVRKFEDFKAGRTREVPDVPFQMLTSAPMGAEAWAEIARNAGWQMTRMNLNTFARHGVFAEWGLVERVAKRLADPAEIAKARVFPYQLLMAYKAAADVPAPIREALQDAMEIAVANVPAIQGRVFVCPDVSGSMSSPVTGVRAGATTNVRCVDVAALVAAAVLRKNPSAEVLPFDTAVVDLPLNPRDSVMTNAAKLAAVGGGGTSCSAPLAELNRRRAEGELVVFVSDNESWVDARTGGRGTAALQEWEVLRRRNPRARMVCIDIQPNGSTQLAERDDVLNVGGFSDHVFEIAAEFAAGKLTGDHWVGVIERVEL